MEKELPKPPELPKPNEKLLVAPTFTEKYSWLKPVILITIAVILVDIGILSVLHSENKQNSLATSLPTLISPTVAFNEKDAMNKVTNWKTYSSQQGKFLLKYPAEYTLTENPQTLQNSIVITSNTIDKINTNFKVTIQYYWITKNETLAQLIDKNKICSTISSQTGISATFNQIVNGKIYKDVPCQQSFKTIFYTKNKDIFYIFTIDTQEKFDTIKSYTDQIFSTFQFL